MIPESHGRRGYLLLILLLVGVGVGGYSYFRRKKRQEAVAGMPACPEMPDLPEKTEETGLGMAEMDFSREKNIRPGIYLLGGFQVINRENNDVTGEFTPVMKQLLSLIILYTVIDGRGVSNRKLKDVFWFDKSDDNAINNRSVNIRKIRIRLSSVGEFKLTSKNSYWKFMFPETNTCDICIVVPYLKEVIAGNVVINEETIQNMVRIASLGVLLPSQDFDFFDDFKSAYSDLVVDAMNMVLEQTSAYNARLALARSILRFSPLDEDAIREECISLINMGKNGLAKSSFDTFVKQYEMMMGEKFYTDFEHFIRKQD